MRRYIPGLALIAVLVALATVGVGATTAPTAEASTTLSVKDWPAGKKAWTVVLLSTTSRTQAKALARKARAKGVPAGTLFTSRYQGMSNGLRMVWAGRFGTEDEAYAAADRYSAKGFTGESVEYVRENGSVESGDDGSSSR